MKYASMHLKEKGVGSFILLRVHIYFLSLFMTCQNNLEVIAIHKYNRKNNLIN